MKRNCLIICAALVSVAVCTTAEAQVSESTMQQLVSWASRREEAGGRRLAFRATVDYQIALLYVLASIPGGYFNLGLAPNQFEGTDVFYATPANDLNNFSFYAFMVNEKEMCILYFERGS